MNHRSLESIAVAVVLIAVVLLVTDPVAGQGSSTARPYTLPRTADGQPDLQGFWNNSTYTPLERRDDVTKAFYTPEEAAAIAGGRAQREASQTTPGTIPDVHYDFTQFGLDKSQTGITGSLRTSLIVDPPNGKLPPLNAEGKRRAAERAKAREGIGRWDSAQSNQLDDRCLMMRGAGPPMLSAGYNSNYQIVQGMGYVMILVEMIHDARIIPLDDRPQDDEGIQQWLGIPRGRWEGDTLVVETTNFNGKGQSYSWGGGMNPLAGTSEKMRVTERFTRVAEDTIMYRFTVEDELNWSKPWSGELPMQKSVGPIFEHACHEGNYGLYNTLVGARLEEKLAAEGSK